MYDSSLIASVGYILSTTVAITAGKGDRSLDFCLLPQQQGITPVGKEEALLLLEGQFHLDVLPFRVVYGFMEEVQDLEPERPGFTSKHRAV